MLVSHRYTQIHAEMVIAYWLPGNSTLHRGNIKNNRATEKKKMKKNNQKKFYSNAIKKYTHNGIFIQWTRLRHAFVHSEQILFHF